MLRGRERLLVASWLALSALACGGTRGGGEQAPAAARLGDGVVALVHGEGITDAEVAEVMRARGIGAREALTELEDEALLAHEARRLGLTRDAVGERSAARRRALAQTVLFALEREVPYSVIDEDTAREAYAARAPSLASPERRSVTHLLVRVAGAEADEAARTFCATAITTLREAGGGDATFDALEGRARAEGLDVLVERLPPLERGAPIEAPFLDAVFAMPDVGVVPAVIRTSYGLHAVVVTQITPAHVPTYAEHAPAIREALLVERRRQALDALFADLARRGDVHIREAAAARALARDIGPPARP